METQIVDTENSGPVVKDNRSGLSSIGGGTPFNDCPSLTHNPRKRICFSHGSPCCLGERGGYDPAAEPVGGVAAAADLKRSLGQPARKKAQELVAQAKEGLSMALLEGELATTAAEEAERRNIELTERLADERRGGEEAREAIAALRDKLRQTEELLDGSRRAVKELSGALETSEARERNAREEARAVRAAAVAAGEELARKDKEALVAAAQEIAALRDELASAREGGAVARGEILRQEATAAASEAARTSADAAQVEALEAPTSPIPVIDLTEILEDVPEAVLKEMREMVPIRKANLMGRMKKTSQETMRTWTQQPKEGYSRGGQGKPCKDEEDVYRCIWHKHGADWKDFVSVKK